MSSRRIGALKSLDRVRVRPFRKLLSCVRTVVVRWFVNHVERRGSSESWIVGEMGRGSRSKSSSVMTPRQDFSGGFLGKKVEELVEEGAGAGEEGVTSKLPWGAALRSILLLLLLLLHVVEGLIDVLPPSPSLRLLLVLFLGSVHVRAILEELGELNDCRREYFRFG